MVDLDRTENEAITVYPLRTDACLPVAVEARMIREVYVKTNQNFIRIEQGHNNLGAKKSNALLSVHALSGCHMIGKFFCKSKISCDIAFKTFMMICSCHKGTVPHSSQ